MKTEMKSPGPNLNLVRYPDPRLYEKSIECTQDELEYIKSLVPEMIRVMDKGVGIAAIQVGIAKRFAVIKSPQGKNNLIINPELVSGENLRAIKEGCLSLPMFYENIERFEEVTIKFRDQEWIETHAVMTGEEAQCLQHELNHMGGLLILDTVSAMKKDMYLKKLKKKGMI